MHLNHSFYFKCKAYECRVYSNAQKKKKRKREKKPLKFKVVILKFLNNFMLLVRELKDKLTLLWSMCTCFVCSLWMWWRFYAKSLWVDDKLVFVYSMWFLHCRICMCIAGLKQIYLGDLLGEHILLLSFSCIIPLWCQTYAGTTGKPPLFVFQWRIKYASVCLSLSYVS